MPRTITIDSVETVHLQLARDASGQAQVFAEFHLKSGGQVIRVEYQNVNARLGGARLASALALFNAVAQDISTAELA